MAQALAPLESGFLYVESERTPMHMGSIGIFEGAPLRDGRGPRRTDAVRATIEDRLHLVPKLRRRVRFMTFGMAAPLWVDDPAFAIANHVRETTLPSPGTEASLRDLCAELMSRPLRRDRPLWEIWLIDGLEDGRVAMLEKLHHSMADGLAGVELVTVLFDLDRHPTRSEPSPDPWIPTPPPRQRSVVAHDLGRCATIPLRVATSGLGALRRPVSAGRDVSHYAEALRKLFTWQSVAPSLSLNGPVGQRRQVAFVRQPLLELRGVVEQFGVTINDLLLTAVAGGVGCLLSARGEETEGRTVQVLVPVGAGHHGDHQLGNAVSAMLVRLPIGALDPVERLRSVSRAQASAKQNDQALAADLLLELLEPLPQPALATVARLVHRQPFFNLVVTDVPGPGLPLYVLGARMLEAFPLVPIAGNLSVGVAALSYDGQLTVGLLADPTACADLDVFADGIGRTFAALVAAEGAAHPDRFETAVEDQPGASGGSTS
jgi:WS/DGAT/MGAT family acyltransferase